ncbi:bifunctional folylpolyglutamate synthase/dihydrofolate synthase [Clostridia bacterium]|nr:bifunctional folylpolyglutamate synthase/dihydrofolate synthase [Clostridia bacterium]
MTYSEALGFIHGIPRFGPKPGLTRARKLLERLGNPQDKLRYIHVAGTNGKGSVSTMLSYILTHAGYKTGLYISPFVIDFRERIQINNQMISEDDLTGLVEYGKPFWDALHAAGEGPSELEFVVALMFEHFSRQKCDIVVLEVGLGGRFDSTNVIASALVSVINSISLDHTKYLGDTIAQIAFEKCGIIKPGGVTVAYPKLHPDALEVVMRRCAEEDNRLFMPMNAEIIRMDESGSDIVYGDMAVHIPLAGEHQIYNTMTVLEVIHALELTSVGVSREDMTEGIAATKFAGRFERFGGKPLIIMDGAHNPEKLRALAKSLEMLDGKKIHAVVAMMADKDVDGSLAELLPYCRDVTVTGLAFSARAMPVDEIAAIAKKYCSDVFRAETPETALDNALSRCGEDDAVLICGSLYLVSELRPVVMAREGKQLCQKQS